MKQILTGITLVLMMSFGMAQNDTIGSYINVSAEITDESALWAQDGAIDIEITEGTEPFQIMWSNGETTEDLTGLLSGAYVLTVIDAEQVTGVFSFYVDVEYTPNDTMFNDTIADYLCDDFQGTTIVTPISLQQDLGAIHLSVSGGEEPYNYSWSNGASTQNIYDLEEGVYSVAVYDANGCTFMLQEFVYNITNDTILNDTIIDAPCFGFFAMGYPTYTSIEGAADGAIDIEVFGGTAPYSFLWNNEATTEDISGLEEGVYSVMIEDADGCEVSYMEYIYTSYLDSNIWDFPVDSFETIELIDSCFQFAINSAEINAYEFIEDSVLVTWNILEEDGALLATFILSYFAELDEAGVYQFEISFVPCDTRAVNAANSFVDKVYVDPAIVTAVGNQPSISSNQFEIYPNPVNDFANIKIDAENSYEAIIEIISINGQLISKDIMTLNKGVNNIRMNTNTLQKGVYVLKLTNANGPSNVKRFVK